MPKCQILESIETEVCNHYVILHKSETRSHNTESTVLKLGVAAHTTETTVQN